MSILNKLRDAISPRRTENEQTEHPSNKPQPEKKGFRRTFHKYPNSVLILATSAPSTMLRHSTFGLGSSKCSPQSSQHDSPTNSRSVKALSPISACLLAEANPSNSCSESNTATAYPRPLLVASEILALRQSLPSHFQEIPPPPAYAEVSSTSPAVAAQTVSQGASQHASPHSPSPIASPNSSGVLSANVPSDNNWHYGAIPPLSPCPLSFTSQPRTGSSTDGDQYDEIPPLRS